MHVFTSENFGDRTGIIMSSSALSIVFTKLERFTGNGGSDLNTYLPYNIYVLYIIYCIIFMVN